MWCYVEDCDALFNRAVEAGCEVVYPCWGFASHKWILTEEEMQNRMQEWLKSLEQ